MEVLEWDAHWEAHGRNCTLKCEADATRALLTALYEPVRTTAADTKTLREQRQLITTGKLEMTPSVPPHASPLSSSHCLFNFSLEKHTFE